MPVGPAEPVDTDGQLAAALAARSKLEGLLAAPTPFAHDDGAADPLLATALADADRPAHERLERVVVALADGRLLVPVLAHAPESCGQTTAWPQESPLSAAAPAVETPGGRRALPVFSSAAALAAWSPDARPVPVDCATAARLARSGAEGRWLLDPGAADLVVPRGAVASLAAGRAWVPAWRDEELQGRLVAGLGAVDGVTGVGFGPGQDTELRVFLSLSADAAGYGAATLQACSAVVADLARAERVDSVELCPLAVSPG